MSKQITEMMTNVEYFGYHQAIIRLSSGYHQAEHPQDADKDSAELRQFSFL